MRDGLRRGLVVVSVLAAVTAAILLIWYVIKGPGDQGQRTALAAAVIGVVGAVSPVLVWAWRHRRPAVEASTPAQVDAAADLLAIRTTAIWSRELVRRGIQAPAPVRVRWGWAPDDVGVPRQELVSSPALSTDPDALPPGAGNGPTSQAVLSSGVVTRLHDEVYARLRHGRLVLIGGPGAGKTGAMLLLLVEALRHRDEVPGPDRPAVPVPLWLTLGSWDPTAQGLREWVVATMARDHPYLRAEEFGPDAIGALFDTGRIALFLDGLDEMPDSHRHRAVELLAAETAGLRVTLSSRPDQYRTTLGAGQQLPYTAVVQLHPVGPQAAARYLLDGQLGPARDAWRQVTDRLQADPDGVLARTLSTPLTLSLARSAYAAGDPTELLAAGLNSETVLRGHLLDQILIAAYPHPRERARASNWLGWIADQMNTHPAGPTRDLRWWDISTWAERRSSRLIGALVGGLVLALTWWLILLGPVDSDSAFVSLRRRWSDWSSARWPRSWSLSRSATWVASPGQPPLGKDPARPGRVTARSSAGCCSDSPLDWSLLVATVYEDCRWRQWTTSVLSSLGYGLLVMSLVGLLFGLAVGGSRRSAPRSIILRRPTRQDARRGRRIILAGGLPIGLMVSVVLGLTVGSQFLDSYDIYRYIETYGLEPGEEAPPARTELGHPRDRARGRDPGRRLRCRAVGRALVLARRRRLEPAPRRGGRRHAALGLPQGRPGPAHLGAPLRARRRAGRRIHGRAHHDRDRDDLSRGTTWRSRTSSPPGSSAALLIGPLFGLVGAFRDSAAPILLCTELACLLRGRPVRFLPLLEEARERQILRQAGAVYQFRHADLQDRLANQYQHSRDRPARTSTA